MIVLVGAKIVEATLATVCWKLPITSRAELGEAMG